jgi:hypothetical protein
VAAEAEACGLLYPVADAVGDILPKQTHEPDKAPDDPALNAMERNDGEGPSLRGVSTALALDSAPDKVRLDPATI